jgi:1,4-alpha-glucan branching enzyme
MTTAETEVGNALTPLASLREASAETHAGMGAIPHDRGVAFRVWAPFARSVHVAGSFNDWSATQHPLYDEGRGYWYYDTTASGGSRDGMAYSGTVGIGPQQCHYPVAG